MEYIEVDNNSYESTANLDNDSHINYMSKRKKKKVRAALMTGGASVIGSAVFGGKKKRRKRAVQNIGNDEALTASPIPNQDQTQGMPIEVYNDMPEPMKEAMNNPDISNPESEEMPEISNKEVSDEESFENYAQKKKKKRGFLKGVLAVATGGASLLADKKNRQKIGKVAQKAVKLVKTLAKNINPLLMPLMPLRPLMRNALKKAGHPVSTKINITDLANQFYQNVVKKSSMKSQFDDYPDLNSLDWETENHIVEAAISGIIKGILEFVKGVKAKKASGAKLSPTEETIAGETAKVEALLQAKAKAEVSDSAANKVGKALLFDKKTQFIVVGVILVIIVAIILIVKKK
jgi:hypothetical protein